MIRTLVALCLIAASPLAFAQATDDRAQPLSEVEIAQTFQANAPVLFQEYLTDVRPGELASAGLGVEGTAATSDCLSPGGVNFFVFMECEDVTKPSDISIDVKKTDSILSPYIGLIHFSVRERCNVRNVVPARNNWRNSRYDKAVPFCLGKTYETCLRDGAGLGVRLAPKLSGSACTGGPGYEFDHQGEVTLTYRWSMGKWEFENVASDPPRNKVFAETRSR